MQFATPAVVPEPSALSAWQIASCELKETPATPTPLLALAAIVPATCVPWSLWSVQEPSRTALVSSWTRRALDASCPPGPRARRRCRCRRCRPSRRRSPGSRDSRRRPSPRARACRRRCGARRARRTARRWACRTRAARGSARRTRPSPSGASVAAAASASPATWTTCAPFAATVPTTRSTPGALVDRAARAAPALYLTITLSALADAGTTRSAATPSVAEMALSSGSASH